MAIIEIVNQLYNLNTSLTLVGFLTDHGSFWKPKFVKFIKMYYYMY